MPTDSREVGTTTQPRTIWLGATISPQCELGVCFDWQADRYAHRIVVRSRNGVAGESTITLAESIEGGPDRDWPASPPLQQLDQCLVGPDRPGLVGVGMAGTSHWSLAVETGEGSVWLDVACRVQQAAGPLQNSYRIVNSTVLPSEDGADVAAARVITGAEFDYVLRADPSHTRLDHRPEDAATIRIQPIGLTDQHPQTVRWRFGFSRR